MIKEKNCGSPVKDHVNCVSVCPQSPVRLIIILHVAALLLLFFEIFFINCFYFAVPLSPACDTMLLQLQWRDVFFVLNIHPKLLK